MTNPDPDPARTPGLEPGGGVPPGETPPDSDSVSAPQGHDEHGPRAWVPWAWVIGVAAVAGLVALMFVVQGVLLGS